MVNMASKINLCQKISKLGFLNNYFFLFAIILILVIKNTN
jgi:hypothetical protein